MRAMRWQLPRLRNRHYLLYDILVLCLTPALALFLRVETPAAMGPYRLGLLEYTVFALLMRLLVYTIYGIYGCSWRHASVEDLLRLGIATFVSIILASPSYFVEASHARAYFDLPRSVPFIDGLLSFCCIGGMRLAVRLSYQASRRAVLPDAFDACRVLVVGAGASGQMIVSDLRAHPSLGLRPVAFLDDDAGLHHMHILNLPVLGGREVLPDVVHRHRVGQVVIALPDAPGKVVREIMALCEQSGVPARTVPSMSAIVGGKVRVSRLRSVEIEDLLRREPILTDIAAVRGMIRGRRVLVTGGGGSIGSELCRQALRCGPAEMAILGHGENSVFEIHNDLMGLQRQQARMATTTSGAQPPTILRPIIADVRFRERLFQVVEDFEPHVIFHAAAHKHVPLMEMNPVEAVTNNVFGTRNLLEAALAAGVERFVLISTDKAVNPTSVMGASKRAAEMVTLQAARRSDRPYAAVRFGNVLGSRGSVVPTFRRQIAAGGPVTVSHPEMTRYFMTIPEAVQLVLQAAVLGRGGEVFMLDMGEPVKIDDLARDLIALSGLELGTDIDIEYTGVRPGEKLFEELLLSGEVYQPTPHEKIRIAREAAATEHPGLDRAMDGMERAVARGDRAAILRCLQEMVPEFLPDEARQERVPPLLEAPVPVGAGPGPL